jgi:hypothetical protein
MSLSLRKIPTVVRARDFHLFDLKGRRYLDLFRNGGRALLGHRPEKVYRDMKTQLQKGAVAEAPSVYEPRLLRLLGQLFPGNNTIVLYRSFDRALVAASKFSGMPVDEEDILEPFFAFPAKDCPAVYHRPLSGYGDKGGHKGYGDKGGLRGGLRGGLVGGSSIIFPVLPFPGGFAPQPVVFPPESSGRRLLEGDLLSSALLAGLLRSIHDLLKVEEQPDIWKDWKLPGWKRFSCYVFPDFPLDRYEEVFDLFLSEGILLSPDPRRPSILPLRFSRGERDAVERLCGRMLKGGSYDA